MNISLRRYLMKRTHNDTFRGNQVSISEVIADNTRNSFPWRMINLAVLYNSTCRLWPAFVLDNRILPLQRLMGRLHLSSKKSWRKMYFPTDKSLNHVERLKHHFWSWCVLLGVKSKLRDHCILEFCIVTLADCFLLLRP